MIRNRLARIPCTSLLAACLLVTACDNGASGAGDSAADSAAQGTAALPGLSQYTTVPLSADLASLTEKERQMIPLLIDAARTMDTIYWEQAYGSRDSLLAQVNDPEIRLPFIFTGHLCSYILTTPAL